MRLKGAVMVTGLAVLCAAAPLSAAEWQGRSVLRIEADRKTQEKVYDVSWSGARKPGKDGKLPPVGNTVNVKDATCTNSIGTPALQAFWKDPKFDPKERAFNYARLLEIPTPRWTTCDAKIFGQKLPADVPASIQERACTTSIWYTPWKTRNDEAVETRGRRGHPRRMAARSSTARRRRTMGMFDSLLKGALGGGQGSSALGGLMDMVAKNPQILSAVAGLLSTRDPSVGGSGGLGGLVSAFQSKGLGDMVSSWISTGPNPPITAAQVTDVLGGDTIGQFARKAGLPLGEAGSVLAGLLPTVIDKLTPDGKVPDTDSLENTLSSLLGKLA